MTTSSTSPTGQPDRFTDAELRDLLAHVLSAIRDGQPLDKKALARIDAAVVSRPATRPVA